MNIKGVVDYEESLVAEICCRCGMVFAIPREFQAGCKRTKSNFYCPQGHEQFYTESEAERLAKQLDAEKATVERLRKMYQAEDEEVDRLNRKCERLGKAAKKAKGVK